MILYAESSAVLAWLLQQRAGTEVSGILQAASRVSCSSLTLFECERVILRGEGTGSLGKEDASRARAALETAVVRWSVSPVSVDALAAARRRFPREPVGTLDAIHLGTALLLAADLPGLAFLTLDRRVAENAALLGFEVLPRR